MQVIENQYRIVGNQVFNEDEYLKTLGLPLTSHHSSRKMICPVGRHFMMQPLRGRHTP